MLMSFAEVALNFNYNLYVDNTMERAKNVRIQFADLNYASRDLSHTNVHHMCSVHLARN